MNPSQLLTKKLHYPQMGDFAAIYDLYQQAIFHYCLRRCFDRQLGEELMQETFLRFWICLQRKEQILLVRAFLYRIARNLIIDHVRRKKEASLEQLQEAGFEPIVDPWHQTYSHLDAEKLLKKLAVMRNPYRSVLRLHFIQGLTPANIATCTGETSNTISVRIFRGLKQLRSSLVPTVRGVIR